MIVTAELKEMYKITVGHDGCCMGCYDSSNEWKESYYGETIEEIVKNINITYYNGLPKTFDLEKVEVLIYDDIKYDYKTISEYEPYSKTNNELREEANEFYSLWNSEKYKSIRKNMIDIDKIKEEREKKLAQIKSNKEKENKELNEYLKLKNKYENAVK
jgi:hypothetical protein